MVTSEAAPFAKTGGLADVMGSLPGALNEGGDEVAVVMPRYGNISTAGMTHAWGNLVAYLGRHAISADIWTVREKGVRFFFVDTPWLYDRFGYYGHRDDHLRFGNLCLNALNVIRFLWRPEIVHLHDWQTALAAPYLKTRLHHDPTFQGLRVVYTIHNLEHQGRLGPHVFPELGLDAWLMQMEYLEYFGDVNLMKGGIVFSDAITTVSPRYAAEIQTPEFGFGLDGLLRTHSGKLRGILNGVDYSEWDPGADKHTSARYSAGELEGKRKCKLDLLRSFGLPEENVDRPVLGIVSRMARQKGFDILSDVAWELMNDDVCLVVLGTGEKRYEDLFRNLEAAFPGRAATYFGFDNALAHKVEAGADIFLMPSLFEPCGLNQIYSLRYGTIPVVRATGGLDDTVDGETGFKFWGYWPHDFLLAVRAALAEYRKPEAWRARMQRAMSRDFSWNASARAYSALYHQLAGR
jgi:starch synthase